MSNMSNAPVNSRVSYQDAIKLLTKRDLHSSELGLRVELLHDPLLLVRDLPNRLSQGSFSQRRLDVRVGLDLSCALQKPVDDLFVDAHRLKFGGGHLEEAQRVGGATSVVAMSL